MQVSVCTDLDLELGLPKGILNAPTLPHTPTSDLYLVYCIPSHLLSPKITPIALKPTAITYSAPVYRFGPYALAPK